MVYANLIKFSFLEIFYIELVLCIFFKLSFVVSCFEVWLHRVDCLVVLSEFCFLFIRSLVILSEFYFLLFRSWVILSELFCFLFGTID